MLRAFVSDSEKYVCVEDTSESIYACKEIEYCSEDITLDSDDSDCSKYPIKGQETEITKVCIKEEGKCKEEYLCEKAPVTTPLTCENYPVTPMNKYTHHCQEKEGVCKEIPYTCENIPKPEDGTEIDCYSLSDNNHICIAGPVDSDLACQFKKCLNVDADDLAIISDCSKYPTSDEKKSCQADGLDKCQEIYHCEESPSGSETTCPNFLTSDKNHACVYDGENKCEEKYYCSKVPKPADNTNSVVCTNYILSETNKNTHLCIQDLESDTYACKEEFLCTESHGDTDQECNKFKN